MPDVLVQFNRYSVDVYGADEEFAGGLTASRIAEGDMVSIAEVVASILKALGHSVRVEEN